MLWNTLAISGFTIAETDGELGCVKNLLIDDAGWAVRNLTVDGAWYNKHPDFHSMYYTSM
jgi:hypothetical protein